MNTTKKTDISTEMILQLFVDRGLISAKKANDNEKMQVAKQKRLQSAYHNTELLLKQYKNIVWMLECFPDTVAEELERPFENVDEMIDRLDMEMAMGNRKIENRMESIKKTRLALDRVNEALTVLKKKPKDGERLYDVLYLTYICSENLTHNELLYRLNLSSRHYYRLREEAIRILSLRIWSAPSAELDLWLDMLALLEE